MAMWKETPTGRREKPGAQKKHVKRPPEEPEDVGVTADRNGEKSSTGKRGGRQGLHCGEANPNQKLGEKNKYWGKIYNTPFGHGLKLNP